MSQNRISKRGLRMRIALIVLAALSGLVVLATFGRNLPFPPSAPINLVGPTVADTDGNHTAIVTSESRAVLILNKDHRLMGIVDCDKLNAPIEAITDVCVAEDVLYVAGVQYQEDSDIIVRERVVAYDMHGRSEAVVYEITAENQLYPSIKGMDSMGCDVDVILVVQSTDEKNGYRPQSTIKSVRVNRSEYKDVDEITLQLPFVHDVGYNRKCDLVTTISMRGVLYDTYGFDPIAAVNQAENTAAVTETVSDAAKQESTEEETPFLGDHRFTSVDIADNGEVYLYDDTTESLCMLSDDDTDLKVFNMAKGYGCIHCNGDHIAMCNSEENSVVVSKLDDISLETINRVEIAPSFATVISIIIACRVYLCLFFAVIIIRKARSVIASGNTQQVGPLFASCSVVLVLSIAIGYISYGSYRSMMQTREREIDTFADYLDITAPRISDSMEACSDREKFRKNNETLLDAYENMLAIALEVGSLARVATDNGIGTYVTVYGSDDKGVFYLSDSSNEHIMGSSFNDESKKDVAEVFRTNETDGKVRTGRTLRDATQYRLVRIPTSDGTGTAGVIEIGSRTRSFESAVNAGLAQRILAVLVMGLVVYLTYAEMRACTRCFISYGELVHHHDAIAVLTRPISFCVTMVSSIDAVMTTLIARSLIGSTGMDENRVLLALPAVMLGVGLAVGQALYGFFGSRIVIQKIMARGTLWLIPAALFAAAAVWVGNFWLYCLAKLLVAIPFGLLYTLCYSLPRRADTDEVRTLAAGGVKRTDTSAAALGTVLGGFVAQAFGNAWVYVLVAVVGAILLVVGARVLPHTKHPLEHEPRSVSTPREAVVKLLTSKTTLPIIFFVMLPAILAAGYNSFLFPLFSANLGIPTAAINNLFVLGQLVVYVSIGTLERLEERYDKWRVAGASIALLAVVFLLFSFNTELLWAVVTIALVGVLCKASDGWKAMWPRSAKANRLATGIATGSMFAVRSVLLVVQPLLLGALLSAGNNTPMIVLGLICAACSVAFFLTTRHSALAPRDQLSLEEELTREDFLV